MSCPTLATTHKVFENIEHESYIELQILRAMIDFFFKSTPLYL